VAKKEHTTLTAYRGIKEHPKQDPCLQGKASEMADMGIKYKEEEALKGMEEPHNVEEVLAHLHDPGRKGTEVRTCKQSVVHNYMRRES